MRRRDSTPCRCPGRLSAEPGRRGRRGRRCTRRSRHPRADGLIGTAAAGSAMGVQITGARFASGQPRRSPDRHRHGFAAGAGAHRARDDFLRRQRRAARRRRAAAAHRQRAGAARRDVLRQLQRRCRQRPWRCAATPACATMRLSDNHVGSPVTAPNMLGTLYVGGNGTLDADNVVFDTNNAGRAAPWRWWTMPRRPCVGAARPTTAPTAAAATAGHELGGGILLAGSARLSLENCTLSGLFGQTADPAGINSVVVRDATQLQLQHVSVQAASRCAPGDGAARIIVRDNLLLSRGHGAQGCSGRLVSAGTGQWLFGGILRTGHDGGRSRGRAAAAAAAVDSQRGRGRRGRGQTGGACRTPCSCHRPPQRTAQRSTGCPGTDQLGAGGPVLRLRAATSLRRWRNRTAARPPLHRRLGRPALSGNALDRPARPRHDRAPRAAAPVNLALR